ncbi:MAG: PadR family transcriptional regulator [Candidatus Bathyarchaeota archaeon]|nr:PadR family transcriptional regulator [Candidatus Bathyarchaeota archaeon]
MSKKNACCPEIDIPTCCDMRGMLSFLILWLLTKRSMYGQEIAEELAKMRGTKPTPGTIYPALKELRIKGLIKAKKEGKNVIYSLTDSGKNGIDEACKYFCSSFGEIFQEYK